MTWSTTTELLPHQADAVAKLLPSRVGGLFAEMGTGKSRCLIELAHRRAAKIDRVVWFCPVSVKETVRQEILKHTTCAPGDIVVFDDRTDAATMPLDRPWYVVGIESLSASVRVIAAFDALVDERTFVDRDTWLTLNAMAGPGTALVMECVSRYPKITSGKFVNLQRLSKLCGHRCLVDVVPLTLGIEYLYTPYSYLDRSILGYAHWYAFREGNIERDEAGNVVSSHDPALLARKIAPVTTCDGSALLAARQVLAVESTETERAGYAERKAALFAEHTNPGKIVTRLADHAHAFRSRTAAVVDHVRGLPGRTLATTNLGSYADRLGKALAKAGARDAVATSFALAVGREDLGSFDHVVHAEAPIVKSYLALDVEGAMRRDATAAVVRGDTKVDAFLHDRWGRETGAIQALTAALIEARHAA